MADAYQPPKSKYNNGLIAKLVIIFADMEERREERDEILAINDTEDLCRETGHIILFSSGVAQGIFTRGNRACVARV